MTQHELWRLATLRWIGIALLFALGAVAMTWPLASQLDGGIPLGTEPVATVPLFNLWTLAWNVESMGQGFDGYWQAPIFHPVNDTFALSEPQPIAGFLALIITSLGATTLVAYNLILIGNLALNGLLASLFLRQAGMSWLPALTGGLLVLALPFTHQELGVLQLVPLAGVLLFAIAALRFAHQPGATTGAAMGAGLALAYGLSGQVAVFAVLASTPALLYWWWPLQRNSRAWRGLLVGATLFLVAASPLVLAQMRATADAGFVRTAKTVRQQSATPSNYLTKPWPTILPTPGIKVAEKPSGRAFWIGIVRVLLALVGLWLAWTQPRWRRLAITGAVLLLSSLLWSLGAHLEIGSLSLWSIFASLPGLGQIRSYFRFALIAQLAVVLLAAGALQLLLERAGPRPFRRWPGQLLATLALVAVVEMQPARSPIEPLPPLDLELAWMSWIERETAEDEVLAFVPFPPGRSSRAYLGTSQWMYWQMRHWRPMVNGYSGFFPPHFRSLKKAMETFPDLDSLSALHESGVRYCIVHRRVIESSPPPDPDAPIQLVPRFQDDQHALAIFELSG